MLSRFLSLQQTFEQLQLKLRGMPEPQPLLQLWQALPNRYSQPWHHYNYLCVDLEFSNLDSAKGDLLSIGWIGINAGKLQLRTARHCLVQNRSSVGQSASIHYIRDSDAAQGLSVKRALRLFLHACNGKILIFHHARVDLSYLNKICKKLYGCRLCLPYCDTLALEKKRLKRRHELIPQGDLRLQACRDRYQLPPYPAHHALVDAMASGELFLAQLAQKNDDIALRDLT